MLPFKMLEMFPLLGEFSYLKMVTTMIIRKLNKDRLKCGKTAIAAGPVSSEYQNILHARKAYDNVPNGKMMHFVNAYNLLNKHSMNGYPCGLHCDFYQKGSESFENKILLVNDKIKHNVGRGGSLVGGKYVFAILDWGAQNKSRRQWYINQRQTLSQRRDMQGLDFGRNWRQPTMDECFARDATLREDLDRWIENHV